MKNKAANTPIMFEEIVMVMIKGIKSCLHAGFKGMVFGLREGDTIKSLYSNTTLLSTQ